MKLVRLAVVCLVAAGAGFGFYRLVWIPFRCNIDAKRAMDRTDYAANADDYNAVLAARENVVTLGRCDELCPWDIRTRFAAAWNLRILHRYDEAIDLYQQALAYDRRPELYAELGNAYVEAGNERAAEQALLQAGRFDRFVLARVERADVRQRVEQQLEIERKSQ